MFVFLFVFYVIIMSQTEMNVVGGTVRRSSLRYTYSTFYLRIPKWDQEGSGNVYMSEPGSRSVNTTSSLEKTL